ncbi:UPF0481 protein [Camellia lanceoleosa]|uniref:UPF0481 protein n=1 Tax=Camellia lanceoleosa TaxID=1840588 RepID=A0ACC0GRQ8_9ERIC|nr:UPF0481 protein [Camellia lanceoleosa]
MQTSAGADFDSISRGIDEKLTQISPSPSECCIFRLHKQLREVNEKAYEPETVAIGPYHRGNNSLQMMEKHKLRYLQLLLKRKNESSAEKYISAIISLEQQARGCYAEPISLGPNEMIEMMVLDGPGYNERVDGNSSIEIGHLLGLIHDIGLPSFAGIVPNGDGSNKKDIGLPSNKKDIGLPSFAGIVPNGDGSNKKDIGLPSNKKDIGLPSFAGIVPNGDGSNKKGNWRFIPNTIELREAGVKLVKIEGASLFDIKFKNGVMKIPPLTIEDRTESFFRNLIAYEQYCPNNQLTCITDYVRFMDCLIDSPKDVEILSRCGIIDNWLGDNEVVSTIFNKISDAVIVPSSHFQYADIFNWVNIHCSKRRNRWMAMLNRNYLNSPWAFISILAALVLLLLTFTQTVFTVFPRK